MLLWRVVSLLTLLAAAQSVLVYSSFWAPLFDPRILNYKVDATFTPSAARDARGPYQQAYGLRGANLIADLGNGKGPTGHTVDKNYGDVKFYYTYPGAQT